MKPQVVQPELFDSLSEAFQPTKVEVKANDKAKPYRYVNELPPREQRVGFSEIAVVMGKSPYLTPLELWRIKVGLDEPKEETFAMRWGKETEEIALKLFVEHMKAEEVERHVKAADGVLAGEVDAIVKINNEYCVVEIKVASGRHAHEAYKLQVNAQLGAVGLRKGYIYTVYGTYFTIDELEFDADLYQNQKKAAEDFIRCVKENTPPLPADMLEVYQNDDITSIDLSDTTDSETLNILADLAELERQIGELETKREELRSKLKLAMSTAKLQSIKTSFAIAELKEVTQERLDTKALKAAHPEIAAKFIKPTSYTQLKVKLL